MLFSLNCNTAFVSFNSAICFIGALTLFGSCLVSIKWSLCCHIDSFVLLLVYYYLDL